MKHIIMWKLKGDFSEKEKTEIKANAKNALEGLFGKIPGLLKIELKTEFMDTSSADMMLVTEFSDAEAYMNYRTHPDHVAAANGFVRPYTEERLCCDYE